MVSVSKVTHSLALRPVSALLPQSEQKSVSGWSGLCRCLAHGTESQEEEVSSVPYVDRELLVCSGEKEKHFSYEKQPEVLTKDLSNNMYMHNFISLLYVPKFTCTHTYLYRFTYNTCSIYAHVCTCTPCVCICAQTCR